MNKLSAWYARVTEKSEGCSEDKAKRSRGRRESHRIDNVVHKLHWTELAASSTRQIE